MKTSIKTAKPPGELSRRLLTRRTVLYIAACLWLTRPWTSHAESFYKEAPKLTERVANGELPTVEERLPRNPMLITPAKRIGTYGGTWNIGLAGYDHASLLTRCIGYENLVRWDPLWNKVIPNLAERWEINPTATVFTFHLRSGVRWSDGVEFTSADILAWYEDVLLDPILKPTPPAWIVAGGKIAVITATSPSTVRVQFSQPNGLFIQQLASAGAAELTRYPRHYARRFHIDHQPERVSQTMRETGAATWSGVFLNRINPFDWKNSDLPTLDSWHLTTDYRPGNPVVRATRNPYYWKIDPAGNQLPYIDELVAHVAESREELLQFAIDGKIDFQRDLLDGLANLGPLQANQERGNYRLIKTLPSMSNTMVFCLNLVHRDPLKRSLFANKKFRIALSLGIDRERIINEVYGGSAIPWQIAPRPESALYNETLGSQFTEHSFEGASALLKEIGLTDLDGDGFRLLSGGQRTVIRLLLHGNHAAEWPAVLEIMKENWRELGIDLQVETTSRTRLVQILTANQHDAAVWWPGGGFTPIIEPEFFIPVTFEQFGPARVIFGVPWAAWFTNPANPIAEEPPTAVRHQLEIYRKLMNEPGAIQRVELMRDVLKIAEEEFYVFGICREQNRHAILKNDFYNVMEPLIDAWTYPDPAPINPCQFFVERSIPFSTQ